MAARLKSCPSTNLSRDFREADFAGSSETISGIITRTTYTVWIWVNLEVRCGTTRSGNCGAGAFEKSAVYGNRRYHDCARTRRERGDFQRDSRGAAAAIAL